MNAESMVSVIVPVYKVEKYIEKCINSIINQTYKNLEIILVDDGSPDNCPQICDDYAKRDSRIRAIHTENQGVSCARNAGIKASSGEYITFVDSDDWLPKHAIEQLVTAIEENNADFCFGAVTEVGAIHTSRVFDVGRKCIDKSDEEEFISYYSKMYMTPWGKLYRRQIIEQSDISFPKGVQYGEDTNFLLKYLCACNHLCSIDSNVYFYNRMVIFSATRKYHPQMHYWVSNNINELKNAMGNSSDLLIWNMYIKKRGINSFKFCCAHHATMCENEKAAISRIKECCDLFGEYFNSDGENEISQNPDAQLYATLIEKCDYKGLYDAFKNSPAHKPSFMEKQIRKTIISLKTFWLFNVKANSQ